MKRYVLIVEACNCCPNCEVTYDGLAGDTQYYCESLEELLHGVEGFDPETEIHSDCLLDDVEPEEGDGGEV